MCSGGKLTGETGSSGRGGRDWECSGSSFHWKRRLKEPVAVHPIWPCHRRTAVTTNTINSGWVSTRRQAAPAQCCNAHTSILHQSNIKHSHTCILRWAQNTQIYETKTYTQIHPIAKNSQNLASKHFIYHLKYQQNHGSINETNWFS